MLWCRVRDSRIGVPDSVAMFLFVRRAHWFAGGSDAQ